MTPPQDDRARRAGSSLVDDLVPIDGRPARDPDKTFLIFLPWTKPPLSLNDRGATRGAVYAKSAATTEIRNQVMILLKRHRLPKGARFVDVQLHYLPADNRRRDTDNLMATLKPICDAISAGTDKKPGYGIVPDDTPQWMGKPEPIIYHRPPGASPRLWLTLEVWKDNE